MGHALDESRTRRLLARVLAGRGDRVGAGSELRQVINYAARSGASLEGALAKELLTELELPLTKDAQSPEPARGAPLSPREKDVAVLIAQGLTNKQIARRLQIAERTAENHVEHILNRLGFQARAQVAAWVAQERLV
jgi:DNA-binding NarL/FixJ family response regulator